jgi:putative transposase
VYLRREGLKANHKRVYRLYRIHGLALRRKPRKHAAALRVPPPAVVPVPNRRWSMDFVTDALSSGRQFRLLAVLDDGLRKCLGIEVDFSLPGVRVTEVLERLITEHGKPELIVIDNGPEFAGRALDQWAYARGIHLHFIARGKPTQNAYVESFAGKLRDECLNAHWFTTLADARGTIERWRREYNEERPHSALDYLSPEEFAKRHAVQQEQLDPRVAVTL